MIDLPRKKAIMFVLYLILVSNIIGMMVYFYNGFEKDAYGIVSNNYDF
ncbi:MAG: hypothetical protein PHZ07_04035 [Patescibacteria group bacterium]|nr:hypothetical protein [Patescibacteria group bacterium]MDD4304481.1 hypothetical protein [Patescibacteria group bacterium]MDD4694841.1 hypothetical protein [Patescibacteria group bacterium]